MEWKHKASGWLLRSAPDIGRAGECWRVIPTDDSGERTVALMSRHSWCGYQGDVPRDDSGRTYVERVVAMSGAPLPTWAMEWLVGRNRKLRAESERAFAAAMDDADGNYFGRDD